MLIATSHELIRAPREHGQVVVHPPLAEVEALVDSNLSLASECSYDFQGIDFQQLTSEARASMLAQAHRYTSAYRDVDDTAPANAPLLLAGHQPQLFHAGVWIKNFAISSLARQLQGRAVNLLIDNDILRNPAIRVPTGNRNEPRVSDIAFDQSGEPIPYEQRHIIDAALFGSFGKRVDDAAASSVDSPLLRELWPLVLRAAERSPNLGHCLAEGRHRLEGQWGQDTWEVPLSLVCQARPFAWFAAHLLANLPRLHDVYNVSLAEYRRANGVRSRSHPVPDLAVEDGWLEAPFWLWTANSPHRERLFVRSNGDDLELTNRKGIHVILPLSADLDADRAVERLAEFEGDGIKLRPRALITTMYARLVLSDLFLHGIGGAKYDQLTDRIVQRFFGVQPPEYMTMSATVLLFPDRTAAILDEIAETKQLMRDFRYHPERHVSATSDTNSLIREKRDWIARQLPRGHRLERHREIGRINTALHSRLNHRSRELPQELVRLIADLRRQQLFASREFSFCLFPEATLRPLLLELSGRGV